MAFRFQKRDALFAAVVALVILGLAYLSSTGKRPLPVAAACDVSRQKPDLPVRERRAQCLSCHDPNHGAAVGHRLQPNHPQKWLDEKFACTGCHAIAKPTLAGQR
ncbi:MAG: hypothetical protein NZ585_09670 [Chloracidobacterium sp.]|nr:hypothetical protein [Chloracidobacterium sp.]MDW8216953.1 hypothetical protein [Acidobacteriota bacterium]